MMSFYFQFGFLDQTAIVAIACADKDSCIRALQGVWQYASIFQTGPSQFQQKPLLRICNFCFSPRHPKKRRIKGIRVLNEPTLIYAWLILTRGPFPPRRRE